MMPEHPASDLHDSGMDQPSRSPRTALLSGPVDIRSLALSGLFLLALFYTLYLAQAIVLPIVLALLLHFLLRPIVRGLQALRLPAPLGAAVVIGALVSAVTLGGAWLAEPASDWLAHIPQNLRRIEWKLLDLKRSVEEVRQATEQMQNIAQVGQQAPHDVVEVKVKQTWIVNALLNVTLSVVAGAVVVIVLLYFLLASGDLFLLKLVRVLPRLREKKLAVTIVHQVQSDISRYLFTVTLINGGLGAAVSGAMVLLAMPNPLLWGVMAGALNFIPYLGAVTSTVVLTAVALLSFDDLWQALRVPLIFVGLTSLEGFLITPTIVGRRLTLNPVVIFLWLTLWGWLWGVAGALLAVPLLATFKILCDHLEPLSPIGEFLGR
jgi:predicted PurR-regulated permease PerM